MPDGPVIPPELAELLAAQTAWDAARNALFSKLPQGFLRAEDLTRLAWGIHAAGFYVERDSGWTCEGFTDTDMAFEGLTLVWCGVYDGGLMVLDPARRDDAAAARCKADLDRLLAEDDP